MDAAVEPSKGIVRQVREIFDPMTRIQQNFQPSEYLGTWYQAYRAKGTPFENGSGSIAEYSLRNDGFVRVINSETQETKNPSSKPTFKEALAFARFRGDDNEGRL